MLHTKSAAEFASLLKLSEDEVAALPTEDFMEHWRDKCGLRSSAALVKALESVPFEGPPLTPVTRYRVIWTTFGYWC